MTEQSSTAEALVSTDGAVMVITLNRPEAKNAATAAMARIVAEALDELDARDDLAVGILTGAGGTFCAGMDLKGFLRGESPSVPGRGFLGLTQQPPVKPLIAAVEGYALAGGCEAMLGCDMVTAGAGAKFGIPEVKRGLVAAAGGLMRLPDLIPPAVAMELALTGDFLDAARAREIGLVNTVVDDGSALDAALDLAGRIAANGPLAVKASKQVMVQSRAWPVEERWERQQALIAPVFSSADAKEGAAAFAEKRAPRWTGK